MKHYEAGSSVRTVLPCAPELFDELIRTCLRAVTKLTYHTAIRNCTAVRLTKPFLMDAPAGSYLVRNVCGVGHAANFAEVMADSIEGRLQQWERIKAVEANDRLGYLYPSLEAYEQIRKIAEFDRLLRCDG